MSGLKFASLLFLISAAVQAAPLKIVVLGYGTYNPRLSSAQQPPALLQEKMKDLRFAGRSVEFSPARALFESPARVLEEFRALRDEHPDVVVFYRSGRTIPLEIFDGVHWEIDWEIRAVSSEKVPKNPTLTVWQKMMSWVLDPADIYFLKQYAKVFSSGQPSEKILEEAGREAQEIVQVLRQKVRDDLHAQFVILFAPHPMDSSRGLFEETFLRNQAAKTLIPRKRFSSDTVRSTFERNSSDTVIAGQEMKAIYESDSLDSGSAFRWNVRGSELWAQSAAASLVNVLNVLPRSTPDPVWKKKKQSLKDRTRE